MIDSYGKPPRPTVLQHQRVAPTSPLPLSVQEQQSEETLVQALKSRSFWRSIALDGIAAAGSAVIVYYIMRRIER